MVKAGASAELGELEAVCLAAVKRDGEALECVPGEMLTAALRRLAEEGV
jgi:hypothetical protein